MSHPKQIEAFNHHLDAMLCGDETDLNSASENDRQALEIASRLAALDLSAQSKQRYAFRRKLFQGTRLRTKAPPRLGWPQWFRPSPALVIAIPGATLLFVLVFVLGWTFTNLGRLPDSVDPVSATAFAIPGTSIESSLPPVADQGAAQAFAPQPLPTPIAPRQSTVYTLSTVGPDQTPPRAPWRTSPINHTRLSP